MSIKPKTTRLVLVWVVLMCSSVESAEPEALPSYGDDVDFLAKHTNVLELTNGNGGRVAICPDLQGRVMTSTTGGPGGKSYGWINRAFIEAGKADPHFNNYGGEDRFWLGPEGGQFALWFAPGAEQTLENWLTPPALNEGAFRVVSRPNEPFYRLSRRVKLRNASDTAFDLDVERTVRLLDAVQFGKRFGSEAESVISQSGLRMIGFSTENTITNRGDAMTTDGGLVSIWTLGMFQPGPETFIIVPYRAGDEAELGPIVNSDYFGEVPPERLHVTPEAILFRGDGQFRSKIGVSPQRVKPVAGSIDFKRGVLTLVHFSLPDDPPGALYVDNAWNLPQPEPFAGDAFNSYNDGPPEPGAESLGGFYELETLAPARPLATGDSIVHHHRTFHVEADLDTLKRLAKVTLGVDLNAVREAFAQ